MCTHHCKCFGPRDFKVFDKLLGGFLEGNLE